MEKEPFTCPTPAAKNRPDFEKTKEFIKPACIKTIMIISAFYCSKEASSVYRQYTNSPGNTVSSVKSNELSMLNLICQFH